MPARQRIAEVGAARGRAAVAEICRGARDARLQHGLSQADTSRALGISRSRYSRIERGLVRSLSIEMASRMAAVVGLELSIRAFPAGEPLRDAGHVALLAAFRLGIVPPLRFATEVPLPRPGDRRAWDGLITGPGWRVGVEAETRPVDLQALERRVALKVRDGDVDAVVLLLADTRHNRLLVRAHADVLQARFPVEGAEALRRLRRGERPDGNAVVLLSPRRRAPRAHT